MPLNYTQPQLKDLPDGLVLEWWSRPEPDGGYPEVVELARHKGVETTPPKAKRDITRRLKRLRLIPPRAASADYDRAKVRWREMWFDQEII